MVKGGQGGGKPLKRVSSAELLEGAWKNDEAYLLGAAYEGKPTQEKALIFGHGGKEYVVPVSHTWDGTRVTESVVRLDLAERIVAHYGSSRLSDMRRTKEISAPARAALLKGIYAWFLPEPGYEVKIVPFEETTPTRPPKRA